MDCNPVFTAFALVPSHGEPMLFLEGYSVSTNGRMDDDDDANGRFPPQVRTFLQEAGVSVRPYEEAATVLEAYVNNNKEEGARVMADPARVRKFHVTTIMLTIKKHFTHFFYVMSLLSSFCV